MIDAQNTISRDVRVARLNLGTDKERFGVTNELIQNAAEAQRLATASDRLGTSSIVDFTQAELDDTEAALDEGARNTTTQALARPLNFTTGGTF